LGVPTPQTSVAVKVCFRMPVVDVVACLRAGKRQALPHVALRADQRRLSYSMAISLLGQLSSPISLPETSFGPITVSLEVIIWLTKVPLLCNSASIHCYSWTMVP
jgi:hypothetical protein